MKKTAWFIDFNEILNEASALATFKDSPNIVQLIGIADTNNEISIITANDISLPHYINLIKRTRNKAQIASVRKTIAYQAIKAVQEVHEKQYIHLDIKPTNFLINSRTNQLILTNFESCQPLVNSKKKIQIVGIRGEYDVPELKVPHSSNLTPATDVFSLGIMLLNLLTDSIPFKRKSMKDALRIEKFKPIPERILLIKNSNAADLVKKMLDTENQIKLTEALNHEWFDDATDWSKKEPLPQILPRNSKARNLFRKILNMPKACRSADQCDDK